MKNNKIIILIAVITILGLLSFIVYGKITNDNAKNNYEIITLDNNKYQLKVNNKIIELPDKGKEFSNIKVKKLSDILITEFTIDTERWLVAINDSSIIGIFVDEETKEISFKDISTAIVTKGRYFETGSYYIEGNDLFITTDIYHKYVDDGNKNTIIAYTEKFTYLGNGKFSESEIIDTITVDEYFNNLTN